MESFTSRRNTLACTTSPCIVVIKNILVCSDLWTRNSYLIELPPFESFSCKRTCNENCCIKSLKSNYKLLIRSTFFGIMIFIMLGITGWSCVNSRHFSVNLQPKKRPLGQLVIWQWVAIQLRLVTLIHFRLIFSIH